LSPILAHKTPETLPERECEGCFFDECLKNGIHAPCRLSDHERVTRLLLPSVDDGKTVAIHPILMMIAILAGVPFMGFVGFILGPVLMPLFGN